MPDILLRMPAQLAADVEAYRRSRGLRATSEALRELIRRGLGGGPEAATVEPTPVAPGRSEVGESRPAVPVEIAGVPTRRASEGVEIARKRPSDEVLKTMPTWQRKQFGWD